MRKRSYSDSIDNYFGLGNNLNQRDVIAVRKTVSGLIKLIYPHGELSREDIEEILKYALIGRRRVKEQLKKIGGMEFYDVHFSYIDKETFEEEFVSVPEQGGDKLIPEGMGRPGHVYTVAHGDLGMIGVYKIETEIVSGTGKFERTGLGTNRDARENVNTAFNYFKANKKNISGTISLNNNDFLMHIQDMQGIGMTSELTLPAFIALCSGALRKPALSQLVMLGFMSIGGTISKVEDAPGTVPIAFHYYNKLNSR